MPEISGLGGGFGMDALRQMGNALQQPGGAKDAANQFQNMLTSTLNKSLGTDLGQTEGKGAEGGPGGPASFSALPMGGATQDVSRLSNAVSSAVTNRLDAVRSTEQQAGKDVQTLLTGGDIELHNVIMSAERAKLELQLTMQLRNKLLEAYQEVMRTPV